MHLRRGGVASLLGLVGLFPIAARADETPEQTCEKCCTAQAEQANQQVTDFRCKDFCGGNKTPQQKDCVAKCEAAKKPNRDRFSPKRNSYFFRHCMQVCLTPFPGPIACEPGLQPGENPCLDYGTDPSQKCCVPSIPRQLQPGAPRSERKPRCCGLPGPPLKYICDVFRIGDCSENPCPTPPPCSVADPSGLKVLLIEATCSATCQTAREVTGCTGSFRRQPTRISCRAPSLHRIVCSFQGGQNQNGTCMGNGVCAMQAPQGAQTLFVQARDLDAGRTLNVRLDRQGAAAAAADIGGADAACRVDR